MRLKHAEKISKNILKKPLDRDFEQVKWDAANDYVSMERVRDVYGVVMDPKTFEIDYQATEELRKKLKAQKC